MEWIMVVVTILGLVVDVSGGLQRTLLVATGQDVSEPTESVSCVPVRSRQEETETKAFGFGEEKE